MHVYSVAVLLLCTIGCVYAAVHERVNEHALANHDKLSRRDPSSLHEVIFVVKHGISLDLLEKELLAVSDPRSEQYGQHWTKSRLDDATRNVESSGAVREYLANHGFTINEQKSAKQGSGLYIHAFAPISVLEQELECEFFFFRNKQTALVHTASETYAMNEALKPHLDHVLHTIHMDGPIEKHVRVWEEEDEGNKADVGGGDRGDRDRDTSDGAAREEEGIIYPDFIPNSQEKVYPGWLREYYNMTVPGDPKQTKTEYFGSTNTSQCVYEAIGQNYSPDDLKWFQVLTGSSVLTAGKSESKSEIQGNISIY